MPIPSSLRSVKSLLALSSIYKSKGKRPYWYHDSYQAYVLRPAGRANFLAIYLYIWLAREQGYIKSKDSFKANLISLDLVNQARSEDVLSVLNSADEGPLSLVHYLSSYLTIGSRNVDLFVKNHELYQDWPRFSLEALRYLDRTEEYTVDEQDLLICTGLWEFLTNKEFLAIFDSYWTFSVGHMSHAVNICSYAELIQRRVFYIKDGDSEILNSFDIGISKVFPLLTCEAPAFPIYLGGCIYRHVSALSWWTPSEISCFFEKQRALSSIQYYNCNISNLNGQHNSRDKSTSIKHNSPIKKHIGHKEYVIFAPRFPFFRGGRDKKARDMTPKIGNACISVLVNMGYAVIVTGIENDWASTEQSEYVFFAKDLHLNGHFEFVRILRDAIACVGSVSGPVHLAATLSVPCLYLGVPWPLADFSNRYCFYHRKNALDVRSDQSDIAEFYTSLVHTPPGFISNDRTVLSSNPVELESSENAVRSFMSVIHELQLIGDGIDPANVMKRKVDESVQKAYDAAVLATNSELILPSYLIDYY